MLWVSIYMETYEEGKALVGLKARVRLNNRYSGTIKEVRHRKATPLRRWSNLGEYGYLIRLDKNPGKKSFNKEEWWFRSEFDLVNPLEQLAAICNEEK